MSTDQEKLIAASVAHADYLVVHCQVLRKYLHHLSQMQKRLEAASLKLTAVNESARELRS